MGGAEKVLEALTETFKGPLYTLIKDEQSVKQSPFSNLSIQTSFLQRIPSASRVYKHLVPFFPSAIQRLDLSAHNLIISSSFAVAKSIVKRPDQLHICYCHTPFRAAWDLREFYLSTLSKPLRLMADPILHYIRRFDQRTHDAVDYFIANSHYVASRIQEHYGRDAKVIHPPVDVEAFQPTQSRENFYITCSRLVPYKRIDLLVEAFAKMPEKKLVIIGDGEEGRRLRAKATKNISFSGQVPHEKLREILPKARAFLFAAEEDFGIVMVEAQAAGIPVIAYGKGGSKDAVLPGRTGLFFHEQSADAVKDAVIRFEKMERDFEQSTIRQHAETFSKGRFLREMEDFVTQCVGR